MVRNILVRAPAKINLHLGVGGRREDGFHDIASVFQAVSLHDDVSLSLLDGGGLGLEGACACPIEKNTAYRAAAAFFAEAARKGLDPVPGLSIAITKAIPLGAGLGGGSSDAASTLAGLSSLLPGFVDDESMLNIAASIGSDVPFFMDSACAAVTGRGELLSPVSPRTDFTLVIVDPGFSISTREAYGLLDDARSAARTASGLSPAELDADLDRVVREYVGLPPAAWSFKNDFFDALVPLYPGLARCRDALVAAGAVFAAMSGSGSALFGVFDSPDAAGRAARGLSSDYEASVAFPLARLYDSI